MCFHEFFVVPCQIIKITQLAASIYKYFCPRFDDFECTTTNEKRLKTHWSFFLPLLPDNRASLLRPGTAPKKPLNEKDISMHLWKNYIIFACRVVPPNPSPIIRCVSPDLMLSSSPESLSMITDRSADNKSPSPLIQPSVSELSIFFCEINFTQ